MVDKPSINTVFIGHVDHGKSTLVGRILLDTGSVGKHVIEEYRKQAGAKGKPTFELAWVMDTLKEERERGVTIKAQIAEFETAKYHIQVSDAPGHQKFVRNMIRGTQQCDSGIALVDVNEGIMPQTREHITLAKIFGINQIVLAVNKMDATDPPYDQQSFENLKSELEGLLSNVGFSSDNYSFVPVSAYQGDNISSKSKNTPWYSGGTLLDAIDNFEPSTNLADLPLRWSLREVMKVKGVGYVPVGHVSTGELKIGDDLVFMPPNKQGRVRSMQVRHKDVTVAKYGAPVGADIRVAGNWDKHKELRGGYVAGPVDNPPTVAKEFTAKVLVMERDSGIYIGYCPSVCVHEASTKSKIIGLSNKMDPRTGRILEESPDYLVSGDLAEMTFKPLLPLVIERAEDYLPLGRFALRDSGKTIGAGLVTDIVPREY